MEILNRNWSKNLQSLLNNLDQELIISSPFIAKEGVEFLLKNCSENFRTMGKFTLITNLSSKNILQDSIDTNSIFSLYEKFKNFNLFHLQNLHSKIYFTKQETIITSGNLTKNGLFINYEYGISTKDNKIINIIRNDIAEYGSVGIGINAKEMRKLCILQQEILKLQTKEDVEQIEVNDKLIEINSILLDLKDTTTRHNIFEKTILYLLKQTKTLSTGEIKNKIKEIHSDLCNDDIYYQNSKGRRFGRLWFVYVRSALQTLKKKGIIEQIGENKNKREFIWRVK
ncbi:MAG: hypothetical protein LBC92_02155 [Rickettsiales bacterium]|jgi:hypothetical protein|nr:hypothetical protein [Rickettsiales bacterium]